MHMPHTNPGEFFMDMALPSPQQYASPCGQMLVLSAINLCWDCLGMKTTHIHTQLME